MAKTPAPFAPFEFMIAWRYLRARRAEGGVSVMTWISLIGITLAVFALIATLSVRSGFRAELVDTITGANAHVTVYAIGEVQQDGSIDRRITEFDDLASRIASVDGVTRAAPLVRGEVLANHRDENAGAQVYGIRADDLRTIPRIASPEAAQGSLDGFGEGIAIGSGLARELGVSVGDTVKLISPNGIKSPFGTRPRVNAYPVAYVFTAGRYDIDRTRVYIPLIEAQSFFNADGAATEIEVMVENPETIRDMVPAIFEATGPRAQLWTLEDSAGSFLRALEALSFCFYIPPQRADSTTRHFRRENKLSDVIPW